MTKPEIKGRGFVKTGKDILELQTFWVEKSSFVKRDAYIPLKTSDGDGPAGLPDGLGGQHDAEPDGDERNITRTLADNPVSLEDLLEGGEGTERGDARESTDDADIVIETDEQTAGAEALKTPTMVSQDVTLPPKRNVPLDQLEGLDEETQNQEDRESLIRAMRVMREMEGMGALSVDTRKDSKGVQYGKLKLDPVEVKHGVLRLVPPGKAEMTVEGEDPFNIVQ